MKTKSLFRMIVAIVAVMLLSCISTSAFAKDFAGTYTFTDARRTYTMVLKPAKQDAFGYKGEGYFYYKGKYVAHLWWESSYRDDYCSLNFGSDMIFLPNGDTFMGAFIKGGYLYKDYIAMTSEYPEMRLILKKKK